MFEKLPPLTEGIHHGCLTCSHVTKRLSMRKVIAVGFGDAHATRDGEEVYHEPMGYENMVKCPEPDCVEGHPRGDTNVLCGTCGGLGEVEDQTASPLEYWTTRDVERLAKKAPDHDWRITLYGPLHGEVYQRHGKGEWMLVESNMGFA